MLEQRRVAYTAIAAHAGTLLFLLIYFWVAIITAINQAMFYAVFPYRYFVAVALVALAVLVPGRIWRVKLGLLLILVVWFSLLPRISWRSDAQFFINAGTLHRGMTVEQAAARMKPYLMTVSPGGEEVWFQPWPGSEAACIAHVRDGRIRKVELRHERPVFR